MWFEEVFGSEKPVIGDIHLPPLPGSPKYNSSLKIENIVEFAMSEAKIYAENGFDGIILENYGDVPYYPDRVGPETVAIMTYIASEIIKNVKIFLGIQVMKNDPIASISIAHTVGGKFVRVNNLEEKTYEIQKFRKVLRAEEVKIFADVEHALIGNRDITRVAEDLAYYDLADAIIISGGFPGFRGRRVNIEDIEKIKGRAAFSNFPILVAGGINKDNVQEYLKVCDGIIIATSLKIDGVTTNPLDPFRVKKFMEKVNEIR